MTVPKMLTAKQAAIRLNVFHNGKPNSAYVLRLIRNEELECVKYSKNYIRITEKAINEFIRKKTCLEQTKERKLPTGKTQVNGESESLLEGKDIGTLAALKAEKKLKNILSKSSSIKDASNVVAIG